MGKKWALFVSRSTITHIVSCPLFILGSLVTRSIVISSHFHIGISKGCKSPYGF
ncbi:hypothetical protein HanRHA438_Chr02g0093811 [Helianthus annuus]|nr:hypothetical protein HanRHA438_Chr02g0093811 [Helianthus annuus]